MTDKEKIRAEVERCISDYNHATNRVNRCSWVDAVKMLEDTLKHISKFIGSLPEEPVSKGLEEEVDKYILDNFDDAEGRVYVLQCARHFAKWQKQQMVKGALDAVINLKENDLILYQSLPAFIRKNGWHKGDKVKLIAIKEG